MPPPAQPTPPPQKGGVGKWIALGCGCLLILLIAGGVGGFFAWKAMTPGEEVGAADIALGQQFQVAYTQSGDTQYEIWLDVDVAYSQGYQLNGPINISVNNQHVGQYQLAETGDGSPIQGRNVSKRAPWSSTNLNGSGSASGKVFLFTLPAYDDGASISVWGTINGSPGLTPNRLRLMVTE